MSMTSGQTPRALVVDDVAVNRRFLRSLLREEGIEADEAGDAAQAIGAIERTGYDLVLLDLDLGEGGRGTDVLAALDRRPSERRPGVMVVTGSRRDPASEVELLRAGASDFVTRPFDLDVLRARVSAALRRRGPSPSDAQASTDHRELDEARALQAASWSRLPVAAQGAAFAGTLLPHGLLSGDVIEVISDCEGRLAGLVLDAAGHGAASALVAAAARAAAVQALEAGRPLSDVMRDIERALESQRDLVRAAAAVSIVRLDPVRHLIEVLNAGSPPIARVEPDGSLSFFDSSGPPLGLGGGQRVESAGLGADSIVILTSDGWSSGTPSREAVTRLVSALGSGGHLAQAHSDEILARLREVLPERLEDDGCILIGGWSPAGAAEHSR